MIAKDLVPIPGSGAYLGTITLPGLREPARAPHKHHWPLPCCPPGGRWPPGYRLGYPGGHRPRYQPVRLPRSTRNMALALFMGELLLIVAAAGPGLAGARRDELIAVL